MACVTPRMNSRLLSILGAASCAWLSASAGCEKPDAHARSVRQAENTLLTVGLGGSAAAPREVLEKKYAEALQALNDESARSDEAKAINAALAASAVGGQAEIACAAYREADARLLAAYIRAKASVSLYREQSGLAASVKGYDPSADVSAFDAEQAKRRAELESAKQALKANEDRLADIRGRSKAKADQAASIMESLGPRRERLLNAIGSERASLAEALNKERRSAELLMKDAELLSAEADRYAPLSGELLLSVRQVERQIESLENAKQRARQLADSREAIGRDAESAARTTGEEAARDLESMRTLLEEVVRPAFETAASKLGQYTGKVGQSRGGPEQRLLSINQGFAAQGVGALHREFGESVGRAALLMQQAADATPALSNAGELRSAAEALAARSKEALTEALQQFEKAKSSFESGGGSPEVKQRLESLAQRVQAMWVGLGGIPPEEPAPALEEAAPVPEEGSEPGADASMSTDPSQEQSPSEAAADQQAPDESSAPEGSSTEPPPER